jgi:hypothetical protein
MTAGNAREKVFNDEMASIVVVVDVMSLVDQH